jgi:Uma2 family endonuclease
MYNPQHKYTLEEYWKLVETFPERKYEYTEGHIRMMTGGSPAHGQIAMNISYMLSAGLRAHKHNECNVYSSDVALQLTEYRSYYPDLSVSCDPADWTRTKALEAPTVVVEVLSPTTQNTDCNEKLDVYQRYPTIQDILLVDSRRRSVKHYRCVGSYKWEEYLYEREGDMIELTSIDVLLTVQDIYFHVYLELDEHP